MKLLGFLYVASLLIVCYNPASAQEQSASLQRSPSADVAETGIPSTIKIHVKRRDRSGGVGRDIVINNLRLQGDQIIGKVTMPVRGATRCTLYNHDISGKFDGKVLRVQVVLRPDDNLTCPFAFELLRENTEWVGVVQGENGITMDAKELR